MERVGRETLDEGDRVRVTIVGVLRGVGEEVISIERPDGLAHAYRWASLETLEVLPKPEPAWNVGDIVRDARGLIYECYRASSDIAYPEWAYGGIQPSQAVTRDTALVRPLELLKEGEPRV